jgi:septal ring-binding cell division protein DamX
MTLYTVQVSNHPEAGLRIPTDAAQQSWQTVYDGPIASQAEARKAVEGLSAMYRHARAFKGNRTIGRLWYAVLRA